MGIGKKGVIQLDGKEQSSTRNRRAARVRRFIKRQTSKAARRLGWTKTKLRGWW